ncbi:putative cannabidiolic acid synthase [Rosa chinensis]|uniref:Putative cannabidiolic acid synthase n=1 Tax=Rosa chinensis TaxID=74649 RepID=A0A2P6Q6N0_ROSCH|nr:putative cannabidiolic acid synthase [Rosa chinensis]
MKLPSSLAVVLFILSTLWLSTTSNPILENFLKCLPEQTHSNYSISEAIYTSQNATFESVLLSYIRNGRYLTPTTPKPLAIVTAKHESHVQATVICAKSHGLQIRIRSGGHDYECLSYVSHVPFVILDMFHLRAIHVAMSRMRVLGLSLWLLLVNFTMKSQRTVKFMGFQLQLVQLSVLVVTLVAVGMVS